MNNTTKKHTSKWYILILEVAIVLLSFFLAYIVGNDFKFDFELTQALKQTPLIIIVSLLCFILVETYKTTIKHNSKEVLTVFISSCLISIGLLVITFLNKKFEFNKSLSIQESIIYTHLFLNLAFLLGFKLLLKSNYRELQTACASIENLLNPEPIIINSGEVIKEYDNKTVLVTGAAGSIGSEIVKTISKLNFKKLILLDNAESPLYNIQQELKQKGIEGIECIVADVRRNTPSLTEVFSNFKPEIVFHAAAYKHVPLMETYPHEAVSVNIYGTVNIANLSMRYNVEKFILISTDKAVNPTNVMGATKRIAELYINELKDFSKTKFITTRFGNVLGSSGSVIPLFKKQIESGGPLTVTHKDITRFFMTIPEACQLVLEAATMGKGGEIFVFNMGKPIKIFDLAKNMIALSGLRYPEDIDIKITGLRPGEKIYEELLTNEESIKPTNHEKIMTVNSNKKNSTNTLTKIEELCNKSNKVQSLEIVSLIKELVPEYVSSNSKFEILDNKAKPTL